MTQSIFLGDNVKIIILHLENKERHFKLLNYLILLSNK